jgi:hypothetical protein
MSPSEAAEAIKLLLKELKNVIRQSYSFHYDSFFFILR